MWQHGGCGCGCGEHHGAHAAHGHGGPRMCSFRRRFVSRDERIAELERYLSELQAEAEAGADYLKEISAEIDGVKERLAAFKAS